MGLASKKPPPPMLGREGPCAGGDTGLARLEKGDGFGAGEGSAAEEKLRPPNASSSPPRALWLDIDCAPEAERLCCCCCCGGGLGFAAYNERMDCFRSGRDGPEDVPGVEAAALLGRGGGLEDVEPKKSKPSRESPALFCLICEGVCCGGGGGRLPGVATEFGRGAGGAVRSSSNRLTCFCGGRGWLSGAGAGAGAGAEDTRVEAERPNLAFSWTTLSGYGCQRSQDLALHRVS